MEAESLFLQLQRNKIKKRENHVRIHANDLCAIVFVYKICYELITHYTFLYLFILTIHCIYNKHKKNVTNCKKINYKNINIFKIK